LLGIGELLAQSEQQIGADETVGGQSTRAGLIGGEELRQRRAEV
jgi:hypothetical protein